MRGPLVCIGMNAIYYTRVVNCFLVSVAMENGKYHSTVKQAYLTNVKSESAVQYLDSVL